ncbi:MAG TPA: PKD domain-containing protein, partial [Mycobacteriales bacterium]|nr:PKD domain-containing protein [Mycobacteriales bacterium]
MNVLAAVTASAVVGGIAGAGPAGAAPVPAKAAAAPKVHAKVHVRTAQHRSVVIDAAATKLPRGHRLASAVLDFGDHHRLRLSSLKAHAKHRYAKRGRYTAVLTVTDTSGLRAHSAATVLVAADGSTTVVPTPTTAVLAFDDDQSSD